MISRLFHSRLLTLVPLALLHLCAAAQAVPEPQTPATQVTAPAPVATPFPDKPFELHALDAGVLESVPKDVKLETMGTGFAFTEGPVWDRAIFCG